jgi:4-hydroxybenzoate polyprenyltransferase/phosphoserine phosphatase
MTDTAALPDVGAAAGVAPVARDVVLCVDLDGTLVHGDITFESMLALVRARPAAALALPWWLLRGRAHMKTRVAERTTLDVRLLNYDERVVALLRRERADGRRIVLATASHRAFAERIAAHLGVFDDVVATSDADNLSGAGKERALVDRYGERGFDYAGNSARDVPVWRSARSAWVANASERVVRRASAVTRVAQSIPPRPGQAGALARALRPHQWLKNLLMFVPMLMAHRWDDVALLTATLQGFVAMCAIASSVYVLNDLVDLEADRDHPTKRMRPFAAGRLLPQHGFALIALLLAAGAAVAFALPPAFGAALAAYYVVTLAYTLRLKRMMMLDVMTLAGLYTLRIIAGAAIMGLPPSFWLLAFSVFVFLCLALVKRYSEFLGMRNAGSDSSRGRGYRTSDLPLLAMLGVASGFAAVLVAALYINSADVQRLYDSPQWLWAICPLLLYWLGRVWLLASRGDMHEDPVVFALTDRASVLTGTLMVAALLLAT